MKNFASDDSASSGRRCWAEPLGDCAGSISREHYVSECLYPNGEVMVSGFPWCTGEPRKMRVETLVRNILCERHNNQLSELDANAKLAMDALCEAVMLLEARKNLLSRSWRRLNFTVNMLLLERWCVKTLIDIHYGGGFRFAPDLTESGTPTRHLIDVAFGRQCFEGHAGLHLIADRDKVTNMEQGRIIVAALADGDHLTGAEFTLWGFPFLLNFLSSPVPAPKSICLLKRNFEQSFQTTDDKGRLVTSHLLKFVY